MDLFEDLMADDFDTLFARDKLNEAAAEEISPLSPVTASRDGVDNVKSSASERKSENFVLCPLCLDDVDSNDSETYIHPCSESCHTGMHIECLKLYVETKIKEG